MIRCLRPSTHGLRPNGISLAQDLLKSLASEIETSRPKRNTLKKALGLLATGQPAPTDEDIRRWLEERRGEKYG